jgi:hypothetical protein
MGVPTVPYEYLFRPPSSDRLQPPAQTGGSGDTVGVTYPKYHGPPVMAQKILDTIATLQRQMVGEPHTPYQETAPPLKSEEGPPT